MVFPAFLHIVSLQEREAKAAERAFWHEAHLGPSQNDSEWAAILFTLDVSHINSVIHIRINDINLIICIYIHNTVYYIYN